MSNTLRFPFKGELEGFTVNHLHKNKWRLKGVIEKSEVLKDAYMIYLECLDRYGDKVDNSKWFFSLYRTCYINYFHSVSTYATFLDGLSPLDFITNEDPNLISYIGVTHNLGELMCKISQAPPDIRKIIDFVLDTTTSGKEFESLWKEQGKKKAYGNEYICRALGYNHRKIDVIAMVYDYFIDET